MIANDEVKLEFKIPWCRKKQKQNFEVIFNLFFTLLTEKVVFWLMSGVLSVFSHCARAKKIISNIWTLRKNVYELHQIVFDSFRIWNSGLNRVRHRYYNVIITLLIESDFIIHSYIYSNFSGYQWIIQYYRVQ